MGVYGGRICVGDASRGDIGCPANAPTVSGSTVSGTFVGDGSGLLGVASRLASLTDVSASAPQTGDVLQWSPTLSKLVAVSPSALVSGSQVAFSVNRNSVDQTLTAATWTKLSWTTEAFDTNNNFASSRFTPTIPGYYLLTSNAYCASTGGSCFVVIRKNNADIKDSGTAQSTGDSMGHATGMAHFNGTTDYAEVFAYNAGGTTTRGWPHTTYFDGVLISGYGAPGSGGGATALSGLTDVGLNNPSNGQVLTYNGSAWVNAAASGGGGDRIVSGTASVVVRQDVGAEVSGTLKVAGTGGEACGPTLRGTIRQNPVTKKLEVCRY